MSTNTGTNIGSSITSTIAVQTSTGVSNFVIAESSYTYMRAKCVTFVAEGLKPRTQYYPFFAGVYVGAYCSMVNGQQSSNLVTDSVGNIVAKFYLPASTFVCGTHKFQLVDNVNKTNTPWTPDPLYGSVDATYEAIGSLRLQQTQATNVKLLNATTTTPSVVNNIPVATNTTVAFQNNNVTSIGLVPPKPRVCEEWYFQYGVTSNVSTTLSIDSTSKTPPTNPGFSSFYANPQYVSTTTVGTIYRHMYTATYKSTLYYQQNWQGEQDETRPVLTSFRPSGIAADATVSITRQWTRIGIIACPTVSGLKAPVRVDPIAQSFFVDPAQYPNGMFITSIEVFFKTVDQSTPVIMELRNMTNGLPGPNILPNGKIVVPGWSTIQSSNATTPTKFKFDSPVFVQPGTDYCFVVKSASLGYNIWCSRVGERDVTNGQVIETQPFTGTLFKSENDVTWIPDSYEDVKFNINVASFDTSKTAVAYFKPRKTTNAPSYINSQYINEYDSADIDIPLSFVTTTRDSSVVRIKCPMHSLTSGDKVTIAGLAVPTPSTAYNGIPAASLNATHTVTVIDGDEFDITLTGGVIASKTGPIQVQDKMPFVNVQNSSSLQPIAYTATPPIINPGSFAPSTLTGQINLPTAPDAVPYSSTTSMKLYTNILINELKVDFMGTTLIGTDVTERVRLAEGYTGVTDSGVYAINPYETINDSRDFHAFSTPKIASSRVNEVAKSVTLGNNPSATVELKLESNSKDISPIIDMTGISIITRSYKIDNQLDEIDTAFATALAAGPYVSDEAEQTAYKDILNNATYNSEIEPGTGHALAKYKSRINTMSSSYNKMSIFVTGNSPSIDGTTYAAIDCYIRTSSDESTHMDNDWQWVPYEGDYTKPFDPSLTRLNVDEWYYEIELKDGSGNAKPFTIFDVKLVMRTTNSSFVPKVFGIRTIATNV